MIVHMIVIKIILIFSCFSLQPPLKYALFLLSNDMLSKRNLNKKRAPQTSDRKKKRMKTYHRNRIIMKRSTKIKKGK